MHVHAGAVSAVEISWQGSQRALEIRRAAGGVVPFVANLVAAGSAGAWQFIRIAEGFATAARADAPSDIHLGRNEILPEHVQRFPIGLVAGFEVIVSGAATRIHGANRVPFQVSARSEGNAAEVVDVIFRLKWHARVAGEQIAREFEVSLVGGEPI